ncbi:MAG: Y-family DNA polymerase [Azovibrio sp.]|uniref:Y-family DNA polymerase n=1 Tax=Azovibrio sp. TaxID=1872673 RepID=UPI003C76A67C
MRLFALVDCNNFYASCEKLFDPRLAGVPVVVLSNNDGCVVARSAEAKELGIAMGAPWFKIRAEAERAGVRALSSNYALYADLSNRVVEILRGFAPGIEVYSIDESFLDFSGFDLLTDPETFGAAVRRRVAEWLGLAVCVGFGPTKTLAKLANFCAKKGLAGTDGVCVIRRPDSPELDELLGRIPVEEVWGVGRRIAHRLTQKGIRSARDLRNADPAMIRSRFSVVLERTVRELAGTSCLALEEVLPDKRQIAVTRSFGSRVHKIGDLTDAIAHHASRAAGKLRAQNSVAALITVFARTSPFSDKDPWYSGSLALPLGEHSSDERRIVGLAARGVRGIYRPGFAYAKAGVVLSEIVPADKAPGDLFTDDEARERAVRLMSAMDAINARFGRGALRSAAVRAASGPWVMNQGSLSPAYTTSWEELPIARAL